jgi:hypothetical protein
MRNFNSNIEEEKLLENYSLSNTTIYTCQVFWIIFGSVFISYLSIIIIITLKQKPKLHISVIRLV